uniref:RNA terminal phosphate cyclase-like 1 n=1 Tax=Cyprinus carpio carpio TaxID=630221 RepID=A0A8C1FG59_CYPCA
LTSWSLKGCSCFRQRLVLSTPSRKCVKIRNIRSKGDNPCLRDFEASFIRLLDQVTRIEINQTGTVLFYQLGLLYGGFVVHECNVQRSIGYYLEALLMLAPFLKMPLRAVLKGVANDPTDPSVDLLKVTAVPLMKKFGIDGEGLEIKVLKRGMAPAGGGEVLFSCPVCRSMKPVHVDPCVRFSVRVSPQMAKRIVDSARNILNKFIPDIYIHTDHMKGASSVHSFFFFMGLVSFNYNNPPVTLECDVILSLCVFQGGCVDSANQSLALLYMTLGQQDVSKTLIEFLRHIRDFFEIMFKVEQQKPGEDEQKGGEKVLMTCVGAGYSNLSKTIK